MTSEHSDSVLKLFLKYCVFYSDIYNRRKFSVNCVYTLYRTTEIEEYSVNPSLSPVCGIHRLYLVFKSVRFCNRHTYLSKVKVKITHS
jgi:hypothetical protein